MMSIYFFNRVGIFYHGTDTGSEGGSEGRCKCKCKMQMQMRMQKHKLNANIKVSKVINLTLGSLFMYYALHYSTVHT